jgi:hypothetical protein
MWLRNLIDSLKPRRSRSPASKGAKAPRRFSATRLGVEALEDRSVPASLSISDVTVAEGVSGTHNAEITVRLSAPSSKTVQVDYRTVPGTGLWATPGSDYDAVSGRLTFAPSETAKSIRVPVHGDRFAEWDETFEVWLQRPKGASIADYSGTVTIQDSSPRLSFYGFGGSEADGYVTFQVVLSAASDVPVTVHYYTYDGTALAGQDYVHANGMLTFAPGETSKIITIAIIADTMPEPYEVFYFGLTTATNAMIDFDGGSNEGWIYDEL